MPKKKEHEYTKTDLSQIQEIFSSKENFNSLYNIFYNGADQRTKNRVYKLRDDITTLVATLASESKTVESPQLSSLLQSFYDDSLTLKSSGSLAKKNQKQLDNRLKSTVKITDKLTKIIPYTTEGSASFSFANPTMIRNPKTAEDRKKNEENAKIADLFTTFTAYNGMAKKYIKGDKYSYTPEEKEAISKIFKTIPKNEELNCEDILNNLSDSYNRIKELDFVKAADRTNRLKSVGFHGRNFGTSGLILAGIMALSLVTTLSGAPTEGGTLASWLLHFGNQALLFSIAGGLGVAGNGIRQWAMNRQFNKKDGVRDQVRQIEDKEQLFQQVRDNKKVKDFERVNTSLDLGNRMQKGLNYRILREAATRELTFGASPRHIKKLEKVNKKALQNPLNLKTIETHVEAISPVLSPSNPLTDILHISGKKGSRKKSTESASPIMSTLATAPAKKVRSEVSFDKKKVKTEIKQEEKAKTPKESGATQAMRKMLADEETTRQTFIITSKLKTAAVAVELAKIDAAKAKLQEEKVLEAIVSKVNTTAEEMMKSKEHSSREKTLEGSVKATFTPKVASKPSKKTSR